jgi:hypothetical protein
MRMVTAVTSQDAKKATTANATYPTTNAVIALKIRYRTLASGAAIGFHTRKICGVMRKRTSKCRHGHEINWQTG